MANYKAPPAPRFRTYTQGGLVRALEKEEYNKPQVCYEFSNGETKVDTDRTENGIYKR